MDIMAGSCEAGRDVGRRDNKLRGRESAATTTLHRGSDGNLKLESRGKARAGAAACFPLIDSFQVRNKIIRLLRFHPALSYH